MTNAIYQATVEELETLLSPRVVSRSLQEGLRAVGKSPATIEYSDVEAVMKEHIFRQLQVTMPVTEAKLKITQILERLKLVGGEAASNKRVMAKQEETLASLQESLKPFNLYFEWPEVQKLRAQLQLLEGEQEAGREASRLVQDARHQLRVIEQKREDQLVNQARMLGELDAAAQAVVSLGGPKVRRLDSLIGQIRLAQDTRQLALAEVERAMKLASDLRAQLDLESAEPSSAGPAGTDAADPGAADTPPQTDLGGEARELDRLSSEHADLFKYREDLAAQLTEARSKLAEHQSVAAVLGSLAQELGAAKLEQRQTLGEELSTMKAAYAAYGDVSTVEGAEFEQTLQVLTSILETALPPFEDVRHLRSLYQLVLTQLETASAREADTVDPAQLATQAEGIADLEATLERYQDSSELMTEVMMLQTQLSSLEQAHAQGRLDVEGLSSARRAAAQLEAAAAQQADEASERRSAQLRGLLSELSTLPDEEAISTSKAALGRRLSEALAQGEEGPDSPDLLRSEVDALKATLREAYRHRLEQLSERAEALGASALTSYLYSVAAEVAQDIYANLDDIEQSLQEASETRRAEQLHDLHLLEQDLAAYSGFEAPELDRLRRRLSDARTRLEGGELLSDVDELEALFSQLQAKLEDRAARFLPRLDEALIKLEAVAKLNSDEVTTARLILQHLDTQRDALTRVSAGVKSQLEASLQKAELLLQDLELQYEATQAVADQLADSGVLDGLFDVFGDNDIFGGEADTPEEKTS